MALPAVVVALAYNTAQLRDVRALVWTPGSLALVGMSVYVLARAL